MSTRHRKVIISVVILTVLASLIGYIIFVPPYPLSLRLRIACRGLVQPIMELRPAVEPPEGPAINFPDPHVEAAIRHALREPDRDIHRSDLERFIGFEDLPVGITILERLFGFNPRPGRISNLAGLEYASNLERLRITGNQIRDITPLANLTSLTILKLGGNQISDISPLLENEGLGKGDEVWLADNPLSPDSINIYIPELQKRGLTVHGVEP